MFWPRQGYPFKAVALRKRGRYGRNFAGNPGRRSGDHNELAYGSGDHPVYEHGPSADPGGAKRMACGHSRQSGCALLDDSGGRPGGGGYQSDRPYPGGRGAGLGLLYGGEEAAQP